MYLNSSSGNRQPQQQLKNSFYKIHMDSQLFCGVAPLLCEEKSENVPISGRK